MLPFDTSDKHVNITLREFIDSLCKQGGLGDRKITGFTFECEPKEVPSNTGWPTYKQTRRTVTIELEDDAD